MIDNWEETAKASEKRVAVWQEKCFAAERERDALKDRYKELDRVSERELAACERERDKLHSALETVLSWQEYCLLPDKVVRQIRAALEAKP